MGKSTEVEYPLDILILGLQLHMSPRGLKCYDHCPGLVMPRNGIIAGCSQSTTFARILLYKILQFLWDGYQTSQVYGLSYCPKGEDTASVSSFVDDLKTTTHGLKDTHVETHHMMGSNMILDLKGMRAKVSKKNVILITRRKHGLDLAKHYAAKGVSTLVKPVAKYLDVGTTRRVRRTMISIKDRIKAAKPRNNKLSWLNKKNKRARALHTTGVLPQASYGVEVTGYSPWIVRSLRTMAADSMGCAKQGRCPITAIALAKGIQWDPYIRGPLRVFKHWAAVSTRIEPKALQEAWTKIEDDINSPGGKPWARVKGPMAATYLHLKEMGWTAHFEGESHVGFKDQEGTLWKLTTRFPGL